MALRQPPRQLTDAAARRSSSRCGCPERRLLAEPPTRRSTMSDPEVERVARFLATHALLLLSVGVLAAAMSVAVIVWAMHLLARLRPAAQWTVAAVANRVQVAEVVRRLIGRARDWTPSAYLALHLTLGLVTAIAVAVFVTLAEEVLAAGE